MQSLPFSKQATISTFSDSSDHEHKEQSRNRPDSWRVWLASAGSITVIATCEVFAVLVVPIMQRVFYQHIIQFLIALAIGSLLGKVCITSDRLHSFLLCYIICLMLAMSFNQFNCMKHFR